jgi:N-acetylmuramoyl-L-alanine amidase
MAVEHRIIYLADKLLRHPHKRYAQRKHGDIARIVIHHSGTRTGTPEEFARYHVQHCGWPGIGYHFVIGKEGEVWKVNDLTTVSFHAKGVNSDGVGICLVGNFSAEKPALAQLTSLRWLIGRLQAELQPVPYVVLHRDIKGSKTSCPGLRFTRAMLRG